MIYTLNSDISFDLRDQIEELLRVDLVLAGEINKTDSSNLIIFQDVLISKGTKIMKIDSGNMYYLLIEANFITLAKQAEILKVKMPLKTCSLDSMFSKSKIFFNVLESEDNKDFFTISRGDNFKNFENQNLFFTQSQRSILLLDLIETTQFNLNGKNYEGLSRLLKNRIFTDFFVLHNDVYISQDYSVYIHNKVNDLQKAWQNPFSSYPVVSIRDYLGLRIARCYNWLQYFVINLWIISILGICTTLYGLSLKREKSLFDNCLTPVFASVIVIWCILFTGLWKYRRKKADLSWSLNELSEFIPKKYSNNMHPSSRSKNFLIRVLLGFLGFLLTFLSVTIYVLFRVLCREIFFLNLQNKKLFSDILSSIVCIIIVNCLRPVLEHITEKMILYENHKSPADFDKSLISTRFFFDLLNNYGCIIYLAYFRKFYRGKYFYSMQLSDSCGINQNCFHMVSLQLNLLAFFQPLKRLFTTIIIPILKQFNSNFRQKTSPETLTELLELERQKPPLPDLGAIHFRDKIMAFSNIALFSTASPIGPFLILISTFIDRLCDSRRLLNEYRRPLLNRTHSIEYWKNNLDIICYLCIVNNAFLVGLTSQFGYKLKDGLLCQNIEGHTSIAPTDANFWIIIVMQNAAFGFKHFFAYFMKTS